MRSKTENLEQDLARTLRRIREESRARKRKLALNMIMPIREKTAPVKEKI